MPGIYGPGNRIHVDDLADICVVALTKPEAGKRIFNVGDGDHASSTAFFTLAARRGCEPGFVPRHGNPEDGIRASVAEFSSLRI